MTKKQVSRTRMHLNRALKHQRQNPTLGRSQAIERMQHALERHELLLTLRNCPDTLVTIGKLVEKGLIRV